MDLTTRDNCLVCGAYETVAVAKAGILSDSTVNREYFDKGFVYCDNSASGITQAIVNAHQNCERLNQEILVLRQEQQTSWQLHLQTLNDKIASLQQ